MVSFRRDKNGSMVVRAGRNGEQQEAALEHGGSSHRLE